MSPEIRILFITRKFPPATGGMEKVAYELQRCLSQLAEVKVIKWAGSNRWLPVVLPYFFLQSFWLLLSKKADIIYLQDGLLAPLGFALKVFRKPVAITIHGLDITYKSKIYQFLIPRCIKRCSKIICISNATKEECIKRGIAEEKIAVIPDGVSDEFYLNASKAAMLAKVADKLKLNLSGKKILLSVGRLVERKGIHWFVEKVIPQILEKGRDFVYLVVGEGLFREEIKGIIAKKGLEEHVLMLGRVDDETLKVLYNVADIFIMPNIPVEGDMEGFGVVALEASSCSLPVVASNLEGIKDAVKDGKNGLLIEPYNVASFSGTIIKLLEDNAERLEFGKSAREFTLENYSWEKIGEKYRQVYSELM